MSMKAALMKKESSIPAKMWIATILICQSAFLFGYALSSLNSCLVLGDKNKAAACFNGDDDASPNCPPGTIFNDLLLSPFEASLATSLTVIGAWIGCLVGSNPSEKYGRKTTLLYNNLLFISGALISATGNNYMLYAGRLLTGLAVGITSTVAPCLIAEIASDAHRGTLTTCFQLILTIGILTASLLAYGFVTNISHGWQYVQACGAIPAIIQVVFQSWIPESPKWTLSKLNDRQAAMDVLSDLRSEDDNVEVEIQQMQIAAENDESPKSDGEKADVTWADVFVWKKSVIIGSGMMFIQAMTGINSVIFYSTTIFGFAGFKDSILATASVGAVNVLTTLYAASLVDRMGRRTLLLIGTSIMLVALLVLSMILWHGDSAGESTQGLIAVIAVLVFIFGFAIGLGSVCWAVMTEIMPTRLRTKAVSLFLSLNWGANLIVGLVTLTAIDLCGGVHHGMTEDEKSDAEKVGVAIVYFIFAIITLLGLIFIYVMVPETKGKTPEEIMGNMHTKHTINYSPLLTTSSDIGSEKSFNI